MPWYPLVRLIPRVVASIAASEFPLMYQLAEWIAVMASGIYGMLLARQHQMDFIGVFSVGFIVAFGGGTLRDLFLNRHPLFWIQHEHYPVVVFAIAVAFSLVPRIPRWAERALTVSDALGLGLYSVVGATIALEVGTSHFIAAMFGVITGTFGGVIGDVVCNRVPSLFTSAPFFATCAFVGSWLLFLMDAWGVDRALSFPLAVGFIVLSRLASLHFDWRMRTLEFEDPGE
ncbi:trimeric intracellular cation channel family protein [Roseiconus nitratireducens]|uniref:Trimeric intracellular cation channel family protein n=1 Tax=Roseiconus nitratireducens TaxID=2605748 RepID=A0A5M6D4N0_9BACT|nr:trimeric intracellular cation channel family protein [Roseiconus nitratireducens]KAA5541736.1 trimeric intracellular cation channel family protein [Roseiconus nitratireducens]